MLSLSTICYALAGVIVFMFVCLWAEKDSHWQTRRAWAHAINNSNSDRSKLAKAIEDLANAREVTRLARQIAANDYEAARVTLSDSHRAQQARLAREIEGLIEANATLGAEAAEAHLKIERVYAFLGGVPDVELREPTLKELMKSAFKARYGNDCLDKEVPGVEADLEADPLLQAFHSRLTPRDHVPYGGFIAQGTEGQPIGHPHPDTTEPTEPTEPTVIPFAPEDADEDSFLEDDEEGSDFELEEDGSWDSPLENYPDEPEEPAVDPLEEKIDHLLSLCQQHRHFGEPLKVDAT